jgi:hypothetical protein
MPKAARALLTLGMLAMLGTAARAAEGLKPGEVLDQNTWQKAEGLLPPEILRHYKDGEYQNKIMEWPESQYNWPPDFLAATKANEGKFKTGERGDILEVATGKQPPFILGHPFPTIDPKDPAAGVKILWNFFYRTWYFGNLKAESQVNWVGLKSLERRSDQLVNFMYWDGTPNDERPESNPQNFLYQQLVFTRSPADLQGTQSLTWRYRDADKRDQTWAYVPALRRVRAVSPANRSDGFLGSDMSQDDGPFFDGKAEDFEWKLVGDTDQYRIAEDMNLQGKASSRWVEAKTGEPGGWDTDWPDAKFVGYMDPQWKGVGWAPTGLAVLAKRKFWVVEGIPRDKYYLYGKLQMYIDKVSYQGSWDRKSDWKGQMLSVYQVMAWNPLPFTRPNGKVDYNQGSNSAFQCAENLKLNRATVAGIKSSPTAVFLGRLKFDPATFDVNAMMKAGK